MLDLSRWDGGGGVTNIIQKNLQKTYHFLKTYECPASLDQGGDELGSGAQVLEKSLPTPLVLRQH